MIDIHCHILPGIDDGPTNIEDSLEMARIAQNDGIKTIINTSHFYQEFNYRESSNLLEMLGSFNELLKKENIEVEVLIGNEIYYSDNLLKDIDRNDFYALNRSKYILIEFDNISFPKNLGDVIYEFKLKGYVPIIAHVERYKSVRENPNIIKEAIREGALVQVNASSITGNTQRSIKKICDVLLKNDMVHFIATDAHGCKIRSPFIKDAYEHVHNKYGSVIAKRIFLDNPRCVINNEDIIVLDEIKHKVKKSFLSKIFNL